MFNIELMKRLIIIGARHLGREVLSLARQCPEAGREWEVYGFLDDRKDKAIEERYGLPIISSVEEYSPSGDEVFVCALGNPEFKRMYTELILSKGGFFVNLIHPSTLFNEHVQMGKGLIIQPNCLISNDVTIGDFVTIQAYSTIGHDSKCGDFSHLSAYTFLGGNVHLAQESYTGTRASILPNLTVGERSSVGAHSLAVRNVPDDITVFGTPATPLMNKPKK